MSASLKTIAPLVCAVALALMLTPVASMSGSLHNPTSVLFAQDTETQLETPDCKYCHGTTERVGCGYWPGAPLCRVITYSLCGGVEGGGVIVSGSVDGCVKVEERHYWA